jgi:hypothetical protein
MAGALGQMCIFYTIANFGALTCSLITTLRKMMQIGQCGKERSFSLGYTRMAHDVAGDVAGARRT